MAQDTSPLLHRDDPDREPLTGHTKVTRGDWVRMARNTLVQDGAAQVKILTMAERMAVSRSSFYWYFRNREELLQALLSDWEARNTAQVQAHCALPAATINEAVLNFFRCFLDPERFDRGLDFAVREWARRDERLRARVDAADAARIEAVTAMFTRYGYETAEADARARILYFMQLGYHALDVREAMDTRLSRVGPYLKGFTGQDVDPQALARFARDVKALGLT